MGDVRMKLPTCLLCRRQFNTAEELHSHLDGHAYPMKRHMAELIEKYKGKRYNQLTEQLRIAKGKPGPHGTMIADSIKRISLPTLPVDTDQAKKKSNANRQMRLFKGAYTSNRKIKRTIKLWLLVSDRHCKYCRQELTQKTATIDHIIPLSKGGSDTLDNLTIACFECNKRKKNNIISTVCSDYTNGEICG